MAVPRDSLCSIAERLLSKTVGSGFDRNRIPACLPNEGLSRWPQSSYSGRSIRSRFIQRVEMNIVNRSRLIHRSA